MGCQRLHARARRPRSGGRFAVRSVGTQANLRRRGRMVPHRIAALRRRTDAGSAHRDARAPGHRRRPAHPRRARDHPGEFRARRSRARDRDVGRHVRDRCGSRSLRGWMAGRPCLVAVDLRDQRAALPGRARARRLGDAGEPLAAHGALRHRRRFPDGGGPRGTHLRAHLAGRRPDLVCRGLTHAPIVGATGAGSQG